MDNETPIPQDTLDAIAFLTENDYGFSHYTDPRQIINTPEAYAWDGTAWGRKATFYALSPDTPDDSICILHEPDGDHLHYKIHNPSPASLDKLYRLITKSYKTGQELSTNGGITPGGIHGLLQLARHGWSIQGIIDDPQKCYWGAQIDKERLKAWQEKPENRSYIGVREDGTTYPKPPILVRK